MSEHFFKNKMNKYFIEMEMGKIVFTGFFSTVFKDSWNSANANRKISENKRILKSIKKG